jgi:hypothetical protein
MRKQKMILIGVILFGLFCASCFADKALAAGSATVSWTDPTTDEGGGALTGLDGYRVYYSTSSHWASTCPVDAGSYVTVADPEAESKTFVNLTVGQTYYFTVMAYDDNNNLSSCAVTDEDATEVSKAIVYYNGDLNVNGHVNSNDFTLLADHYGQDVCGPTEPSDINRDCHVNSNDFTLLAEDYGN